MIQIIMKIDKIAGETITKNVTNPLHLILKIHDSIIIMVKKLFFFVTKDCNIISMA